MINKEITLWRQLIFQIQNSWETLKNQSMNINEISRKLRIFETSCNSLIVWHVAWQIRKIGRDGFVPKCTRMVKNLSTLEFDISKWLVKRLVKIHRIHKQICYVWKFAFHWEFPFHYYIWTIACHNSSKSHYPFPITLHFIHYIFLQS